MRRYSCPVAAQNIAAHRQFVVTFGQIEKEYRASGASSSITIRVQRELADWLARHIKGTDTSLRSCVKAA
jgi:hemerythrin